MSQQNDRMDQFIQLLRQRGVHPEGRHIDDERICERFQGNYAVLVLDSSGFTRLTRDHGIIHFMSLIVNMREEILPLFEKHAVIESWYEADNLFGIFPSAMEAVKAAIETQERMHEINAKRGPAAQLEVCIGIGSGRLLYFASHHIFGQEMNFASKLGEDVADPREILLTESAYSEIKDRVSGLDTEYRSTCVSDVTIHYYDIKPTGSLTWKK